ncbi:MAG: zeta toxin family protein, partial [Firmicutes bacterium]|nr:zeta toxin family protein [Bacillota bacterium]
IEPERGRKHAVLFVGPTGSGKTTTIAKLAAQFSLQQQRSVALITTDTYRVAAVEQLRTYADILGVSFHVAMRPSDVAQMVRQTPAELIFIDTAGHSYKHELYQAELRSIAEAAPAQDVILTLPATMQQDLMVETAQHFARNFPLRVAVTKVDETRWGGAVLSALMEMNCPLAYVTTGQRVPDDIAVARGDFMARWACGEEE